MAKPTARRMTVFRAPAGMDRSLARQADIRKVGTGWGADIALWSSLKRANWRGAGGAGMRTYALAALMLVLAGTADAAPAAAPANDERSCDGGDTVSCRYIIQATREFTSMLTTSDPAPLRRHLDSRALWVSTAGIVHTGEQLIQSVSRDSPRAVATLDRVNVRFYDNVAIVIWSESWTSPGAAVPAGRLAGVDTWARRRGRWRLVLTAESRVPP